MVRPPVWGSVGAAQGGAVPAQGIAELLWVVVPELLLVVLVALGMVYPLWVVMDPLILVGVGADSHLFSISI